MLAVGARSVDAERPTWRDGIDEIVRGAFEPVVRERDELRRRLAEVERERDRYLKRCEAYRREVAELKTVLEEAQRAAKRQAAPFGRKRRKKNPKRPGRKRGHAPANRAAPDHVDTDVQVPLDTCPHCNGPVEDKCDLPPQTVIDVPPVKPKVTRYHNQSGYCRRCKVPRAQPPRGAVLDRNWRGGRSGRTARLGAERGPALPARRHVRQDPPASSPCSSACTCAGPRWRAPPGASLSAASRPIAV